MNHPMRRLLACKTRAELKTVWLSLSEVQRIAYRPNEDLARHAWRVLWSDPKVSAA